jgi:hypothetical protein
MSVSEEDSEGEEEEEEEAEAVGGEAAEEGEEEEEEVAAKGGAKRPASTQDPAAKKSKGSDGKALAPAAAKPVTKPGVGTPQGKDTTPVKAVKGPDPSADFIASPTFTGSKAGMVFKKGAKVYIYTHTQTYTHTRGWC